ncbi:hypothetical protein SERLA73DRAFT_189919 [Serpula lacrymans var. lacrymans S7.3]|uniref:Elongation factor Ts, mitochondrial n=2 Tax=Serpula lacrymans var. lacrymans TaxID=341189 RepID=F8QET3_SERL3|nr:uncharacterized protein SERLADRAFT_455471 [Serpula lacrymans var. lacrymans S7.9]EGN93096.1 hypothetical protein SERLA73DRAFT_189919 [Serpula lacrymans var. lacrymans S7.3]EGO30991.1 hypothetical protein SERLADRAFT_455471 [Serpula lacrymans var. lacrymans S7.9]
MFRPTSLRQSREFFLSTRFRCYSTSSPKPTLQLVAQLRKLTEVSITKAREALTASNNDVNGALAWLEADMVASGAQRAAKLEGRVAREGLVSISVLSAGNAAKAGLGKGSVRAAMVELNCETDFVGRGELFSQLAADIAHTAAFISEPVDSDNLIIPCPLDVLNDAPLISQNGSQAHSSSTVSTSIRDLMAKVGEKVSLRRAITLVQNPLSDQSGNLGLRLASYVHGAVNSAPQGKIGAIALLALKSPNLSTHFASEPFTRELERLERAIARQIVGLDTLSIRSNGSEDGTALYDQPFMMYGGDSANETVRTVLNQWALDRGLVKDQEEGGVEVIDFAKWTVGSSDVE